MTRKGIENFPQLQGWAASEIEQLGYKRFSVSIFDHWLTREEWLLNPFVSLEQARAYGLESAYHQQNRGFRDFYRSIFEAGVYRVTGTRVRPQVAWHPRWDRRLKKAVTAMVEDRTWGAEFYAPAQHIRIISAHDRTDTVLLEAGTDEEGLSKLAQCFGLHLIA